MKPARLSAVGAPWCWRGSQYYVRTWPAPFDPATAVETRITDFPHPYPKLKNLQKEIVKYERDDGTPLTATLYQPPGYVQVTVMFQLRELSTSFIRLNQLAGQGRCIG